MLQNSFMMGGRLDRYSDWRLDIDHMSYEVVYIPLVAFYFDYTSWQWCVGLLSANRRGSVLPVGNFVSKMLKSGSGIVLWEPLFQSLLKLVHQAHYSYVISRNAGKII